MQRPNEQKRKDIVSVATRLFATRPFHEVRLDDIAAKARIGKGTIYIYFKSKDDLYEKVVREGFSEMLGRMREQLKAHPLKPSEALRVVIHVHVEFAAAHRWIYQLLRFVQTLPNQDKNIAQRIEIGQLITGIIREGNKLGEFSDPHPELTAHFIPAAVRASVTYGPENLSKDVVAEQVYRIMCCGLKAKGKKA